MTVESGFDPAREIEDDHRKVRDAVFDLLSAIDATDCTGARAAVHSIDLLAGPHWRWEEEALYLSLRRISPELVDGLLREHDTFIAVVEELTDGFAREVLTPEDWARARDLTRPLLYHLGTCNGLTFWMDILTDDETQALQHAVVRARRDGLSLLQWAQDPRHRGTASRFPGEFGAKARRREIP